MVYSIVQLLLADPWDEIISTRLWRVGTIIASLSCKFTIVLFLIVLNHLIFCWTFYCRWLFQTLLQQLCLHMTHPYYLSLSFTVGFSSEQSGFSSSKIEVCCSCKPSNSEFRQHSILKVCILSLFSLSDESVFTAICYHGENNNFDNLYLCISFISVL